MSADACIVADWSSQNVRDVTADAPCAVVKYQVVEAGEALVMEMSTRKIEAIADNKSGELVGISA